MGWRGGRQHHPEDRVVTERKPVRGLAT